MSTRWGSERGTPVDRYFIDGFLESRADVIAGRVLEIKNRLYTTRFDRGVSVSDVLDIDESNRHANIVADLAAADEVPSDTYDCFILTETLHVIYEVKSAIFHAHRILKPGGSLLVTAPCISPMDSELADIESWRFTRNSCRLLFEGVFGEGEVEIETYGNFVTCTAFLAGMAVEELDRECLLESSDIYVQGVCVHARKR
ncbi:MAG: methyltransferase domain-containing protein [Verrucomicrobiales bacterium]